MKKSADLLKIKKIFGLLTNAYLQLNRIKMKK